MILSGAASQGLGARLAAELGAPLGDVTYDRFPDGEQLVEVPSSIDGRAIVVSATISDAAHVQTLQLQDAAREAGAEEVVTVLPYLGYARQDTAFEPGQPVSARAVAAAISTGTDRVLTVTPHEPAVLEYFDVPASAVDAASRLAEPLPSLSEPVFLAPDESAAELAVTVRDAYGEGEVDHFEKERHSGSEVAISPHAADVTDRDVLIVDDIVATGETMSEAIAHLDDPASVSVACVHPLLVENARTRLARAGVDHIYGTDTVERAVTAVSVAPSLAAHL
jgi:ribose-phosphate pyrophosphokinase